MIISLVLKYLCCVVYFNYFIAKLTLAYLLLTINKETQSILNCHYSRIELIQFLIK